MGDYLWRCIMKREHIYKLREILHKASAFLDDTDALEGVELFPMWTKDTVYSLNVRVQYNKKLYKCV
jgi:hypothetical protein